MPTAAAIANAIRDATGADVTSLPIDREEILRALRDAEAAEQEGARCNWSGLARSADAVAALADGAVALAGGTELVPLLREGLVAAETARRRLRRRAARRRRADDRRRHQARRARSRSADPGGAPGGLPPRRLAAAPQHGHDRRQPAPGDALLVLAARLPLLPARRRPLPREGRAAPRARVLRQRALRLGAPLRSRPPPCSPSERGSGPTAASSSSPSSTGCRPTTTARRRRSSPAS